MLIRETISNKIWPVFLVVAFSFAGCSRPIDSENVNSAEMEADAIETGDSQAANGDQKIENNHTADDNQKTENNHAADANPETENHQEEEEDQKQSIWEKSEELFVLGGFLFDNTDGEIVVGRKPTSLMGDVNYLFIDIKNNQLDPQKINLKEYEGIGENRLLDIKHREALFCNYIDDILTLYSIDLDSGEVRELYSFSDQQPDSYYSASGKLDEDQMIINCKTGQNYNNFGIDTAQGTAECLSQSNSSLPVIIDDIYYYIVADPAAKTTEIVQLLADGSAENTLIKEELPDGWINCLLGDGTYLYYFVEHNQVEGIADSTEDTKEFTECFRYDPSTSKAELIVSQRGQIADPEVGGKYLTWWNPVLREESRLHTRYFVYDLERNQILEYDESFLFPTENSLFWIRFNKDEDSIPIGEAESDGNISLMCYRY